ncbi:MAG: PaaI family thioesterase [Polyangiaceae bacterium]|jgi:uncharacterized protein (TIGR00369 family)
MHVQDIVALAQAAVAGEEAALAAFYTALQAHIFGGEGHLGRHLGVEVVSVARDAVTMRLPWRPALRRVGDIFHGGAIMALGDHVAGCLFNTDPRIMATGSTGLTTDFTISFLRGAGAGEAIVGTGAVLRRGRHVTFMQIDVRGEVSGRTIATCRTTYLTVPMARVGARVGEGKG